MFPLLKISGYVNLKGNKSKSRFVVPFQIVSLQNSKGIVCIDLDVSEEITAAIGALGKLAPESWAGIKHRVRTLDVARIIPPYTIFMVNLADPRLETTLFEKSSIPPPGCELYCDLLRTVDAQAELLSVLEPQEKPEEREEEMFRPDGFDFWREEEKAEKKFPLPNKHEVLMGLLVGLLAYLFPPLAGVMFGYSYGIGGWAIFLAFLMGWTAKRFTFPLIQINIFLFTMAVVIYLMGLSIIYKEHHMKFELFAVFQKWWRIAKKKQRPHYQGFTGFFLPETTNVWQNIVLDLLIGLGAASIFFPQVTPFSAPVLLFLLANERKERELWRLFVLPALLCAYQKYLPLELVFRCISIISHNPKHDWKWASYETIRRLKTNLDIKKLFRQLKEKLFPTPPPQQLPQGLVQAYKSVVTSFLWDDLINQAIDRAPNPGQVRAWLRRGWIPLRLGETRTAYAHIYTIHPEIPIPDPQRWQQMQTQILLRWAQSEGGYVSAENKYYRPALCLPSVGKSCVNPNLPPPVVQASEDTLKLFIPIGVSSVIYHASPDKHKHYYSLWELNPEKGCHIFLATMTGGGKTNLLRVIHSQLATLVNDYPILAIHLEGKAELNISKASGHYYIPPFYLSTPQSAVQTFSALHAILTMRSELYTKLTERTGGHTKGAAIYFHSALGHAPLLLVIIDEFWELKNRIQTLGKIVVMDGKEKRTAPAAVIISFIISSLTVTGRALGFLLALTTQSVRKEALLPPIRDNTRPALGNPGRIHPSLLDYVLGSRRKEEIEQILNTKGIDIPQYTFLFSHDGILSVGDENGVVTMPDYTWDVVLPPLASTEQMGLQGEWRWSDIVENLGRLIRQNFRKTLPDAALYALAWQAGFIPCPSIDAFLDFGKRHAVTFIRSLDTQLSV